MGAASSSRTAQEIRTLKRGSLQIAFAPAIEMDFSLLLPPQAPLSRLQERFVEHMREFVATQVPSAYRVQ
jgi:hypothetical protein